MRARRRARVELPHEHDGIWVGRPRCRRGPRLPARGRPTTAATRSCVDDPYRYLPTLGEMDLHLINEGRHEQLWDGARRPRAPLRRPGRAPVTGTSFAVWAPSAQGVRLKGDFNSWDGRAHPMRQLGTSGVWELFVPGVGSGDALQVRRSSAPTALAREGRPDGLPRRGPAGHRVAWSSSPSHSGATTTGWPRARRPARVRRADVASTRCTSARGGTRHGRYARAGRRARRRTSPDLGLHARRAAAGDGAPVRRLVGLPGHVVLRADLALRRPRRLPAASSTGCTRPASA